MEIFSERATTPFFTLMLLFSISLIEKETEKKKQESLSPLPQSLRNWISFGRKNQTRMLLLPVGKFKLVYNDSLTCFKNFFSASHICYYDSKDYVCLLSYLELQNLWKSVFLDLSGKTDLCFSSVFSLELIESAATMSLLKHQPGS